MLKYKLLYFYIFYFKKFYSIFFNLLYILRYCYRIKNIIEFYKKVNTIKDLSLINTFKYKRDYIDWQAWPITTILRNKQGDCEDLVNINKLILKKYLKNSKTKGTIIDCYLFSEDLKRGHNAIFFIEKKLLYIRRTVSKNVDIISNEKCYVISNNEICSLDLHLMSEFFKRIILNWDWHKGRYDFVLYKKYTVNEK